MKGLNEYVRPVTTKGQVTIPAEVRRLLKIKPRGRVMFRVRGGRVELQPTTMTLEATFGAVKPRRRPEDFKKLRETAIGEHARNVVAEMRG